MPAPPSLLPLLTAPAADAGASYALDAPLAALLARLDLNHIAGALAAEEIDIEALPLLSISDLVDIAIKPDDAEKLVAAAAPARSAAAAAGRDAVDAGVPAVHGRRPRDRAGPVRTRPLRRVRGPARDGEPPDVPAGCGVDDEGVFQALVACYSDDVVPRARPGRGYDANPSFLPAEPRLRRQRPIRAYQERNHPF